METWRQARAEQTKQLGGQAPIVPPELQGLSPAITARDKEIARLRADATDRRDFGAMLGGVNVPGLSPQERSAANEARIRQLQDEQRADIARLQRQLLAEGAAPGATGPGPADAAIDAITKALESGKARLRQMDVGEDLLPGLELAKDKTTEWRKVLDEVFAQIQRIPEPLLRSIMPAVQRLIDPANQLMLALQRDADLAKDAAGEVGEMRKRVAEGERAAAQELAEDRKRRQAERGELDIFGLCSSPEQDSSSSSRPRSSAPACRSLPRGSISLTWRLHRNRKPSGGPRAPLICACANNWNRRSSPASSGRKPACVHEAARTGVPITAAGRPAPATDRAQRQQEKLNQAVEVWHDLAMGVGSAWSSALALSPGDGDRLTSLCGDGQGDPPHDGRYCRAASHHGLVQAGHDVCSPRPSCPRRLRLIRTSTLRPLAPASFQGWPKAAG